MASTNSTAKTRELKTRTPGEPVEEKQMPPQADATENTQDTQGDEGANQASQDNDSEDQAALMEAEVQRRVRAELRKRKAPVEDGAHLPDQSEIDAGKIKRATLSRQGYVCPAPKPEAKGK